VDPSQASDWWEDSLREELPFYLSSIHPTQWNHELEWAERNYPTPYVNEFIREHYRGEPGQVVMIRVAEHIGIRSLDFADLFGLFAECAKVWLSTTPFDHLFREMPRSAPFNYADLDDSVGTTIRIQVPTEKGQGRTMKTFDLRESLRATELARVENWRSNYKKAFRTSSGAKVGNDYDWGQDISIFCPYPKTDSSFPCSDLEYGMASRVAMGLMRALFPHDTAAGMIDPEGRTHIEQELDRDTIR